jgi:hypothetical protein
MVIRRKITDVPDRGRRTLIKWTIGAGAALGLRPWKIFEVNESVFGTAFAAETAHSPVHRLVANVMGDGSFAWMTQLFPFTAQATEGNKAFYAAASDVQDQPVAAGDHTMKLSPHAPHFGGRKITGFLCGTNEAHTRKPNTAARIQGVSMLAAASSLQLASPTLVPTIAIGDMPYGSAPGAPLVASVPNSNGFIDLFSSAAASTAGTLSLSSDAALFEAAYKANRALHRAAGLPTIAAGLRTGKTAAALLSKNLGGALRPTTDDLVRYGVPDLALQSDRGSDALADIAKTLIITVKAFKMNLTNAVIIPGTNDDPHTAFDNHDKLVVRVAALKKIWEAFITDLAADDPSSPGTSIADNTVITWVGDTGKDPNTSASWPDPTPALANWMYVLGAGHLRAGWFGEIRGDGSIATWDPTSGGNIDGGSTSDVAALAGPAAAAVLYAVSKGDLNKVARFYRGPSIAGIVR